MAKNSNEVSQNKKFINKIYKFLKKHWIWCSIIVQIPTIWYSVIIPFMGKKYTLTNSSNELTFLGIIITVIIVVLSSVFTLLNNLISNRFEINIIDDREDLDSKRKYFNTITSSLNKICEEKYSTLLNFIDTEINLQTGRVSIISNPDNQLKRINEGITECLAFLLSNTDNIFSCNDFLVSIAYRFPLDDNTWRWTDGIGQKEMDFDVLLSKDCKSTFNYLINTKNSFYFNNSKEKAARDNYYAFTPQDKTLAELKEVVGSIFCCKYQVKNKRTGTVYVDSMISVTTQGKRFCDSNKSSTQKKVRNNMYNLIMYEFGNRIGIELSLLYLEYLKKHELQSNNNQQDKNIKGTN